MAITIETLIQDALKKKIGNKELMIYWHGYEWTAEIGNPSPVVYLGESEGEYKGSGLSIEEALINMIDALRKGQK